MFIMDMFPYPSGKGLHVGHPLGYIATDAVARHNRMLGKNVLYTMGYDAFGLPAEQYAIQTGTHPRVTTDENVANMARQLFRLGLSHDSRRSLRTTDLDFVKWTQWVFLQLFDSWYDPNFVKADGTRGSARPISELKGAIQDRDVDPYALAEQQGIEIPQMWHDRKPDHEHWNPEHDTPFDYLIQYTPEDMRELVDCFRLAYVSDTPRSRHRARERGSHGRGPLRTRRFPRVQAPTSAVEPADHRVRRSTSRGSRDRQLARIGQVHAAQLDRPLTRCAGDVRAGVRR